MRTPAGAECRFYYEDYNRGRSIQECRLIQGNTPSRPWHSGLCKGCPVPGILQANACPNMVLEARVGRRWLVQERVQVRAYCKLTEQKVAEPMVGCGHCQDVRWQALEESLNKNP